MASVDELRRKYGLTSSTVSTQQTSSTQTGGNTGSTQSRSPVDELRAKYGLGEMTRRNQHASQKAETPAPKRASSAPVVPEAEQRRQSERDAAGTNRANARTSYTDLRNTRDSIKAKADDMMAEYDQKISAGASKEELADEYAKIMKQYGLVTDYDKQVEDAYAALKQADQEYKDVYADYNSARREVKAATRNLRDVESQYAGWATDDLSAQNVEQAMNNAEDVKAARTRLANAREAYIAQGGNPDANIVSAGLKGSAAGVVDTFGYLQELGQPENEKRWGIFTTGHMTEQQKHHQEVLQQREKEKYEAEHGAGTYQAVPGYIRTQNMAADLQRQSAEQINSMKAGRSELGQFAVDMGVQGVQMGADAVAGKVIPGGSLTAMALRSFGSGVREAREAGADIYQQGLYGAGAAAVEVLTEKMFDGLAGIYGAGAADDIVSHAVGRFTQNRLGQAALGMVADAAGEGLEEVISDLANPVLRSIYDEHVFDNGYFGALDGEEILYDFLVGAAMGFVGGSVEGVTEATGLNAPDARSEFFMEAGEKGISFGEAIRDWKALQQVSGASVEAQTDAAFDVLTGKESLEQQQERQSNALQRWGLTEEEAKNYIDTGRVYNPLTVSARDRGTVTLGGEEVKIVSAKGEDVTVEQNGEKKTVKLDELEGMSEGYKKLVQAAAESEYGEAVLRLYNPGQDVDAYTKAWSYAEDVFGAQTNISQEKARENPLLKDLTDGQLKFALELGRQRYDASKATAAQRAAQFKAARQEALKNGAFARKKGTVNTKGGTFGGRTVKGVDVKRLSTPQKKIFAMTQALADAVNINFVVYDGEANEGGSYIKGGTVMVNINSGQLSGKNLGAASLSHELTHYLQDFSPEEYGQLKDFITSEILKASPEKFAQLVQKQMDLEPNISPEAAGDEVIANACQTMLLNSKAVEKLARQNMNLAERISDWISETAKKIKAAYKSVDLNDNVEIYEAARAISGVMDEAQKLWDKALLAADENYNAEQATGKKNTADNGGVQNVKYGMTELTNKPDMHLTIVNDTAAQSRSDILDAGMKNAKRYGGVTKDGAVFVHVKDNGDDVHVTRDGLRHGLDRRKQVNAPVTMKVGEVLSNAIEINELNPRDLTRTQETKVLIGAAKNQNNEPYIALFVVNRTTGQLEDFDTLYSVNAKTSPQNKKKSAGSLSPGSGQIVPASLTDSDISIADLLQYVNKYFPDVLPEEVLKHFGHSSRPEGKLGASALFQKWGIGETAEEREARKESISNLKTENSILRARAKYWRDQTRQTRERTVRQQDTDRMANDLLREYESRTDKAEIKSDLKALGDYLVQAEELDYEELHDRAEDIADRIIDGNYTLIDDSNKENLDRLKGFLKGTALNLSASDFSDTGDEGFRKRYGRYVTVRENGRSIDSAWGELAGMFGEGLFPEDTYAPGDMLRMIGDYLDLWRPQYGNIFENARAEAVEAVTNEIIDRMLSEEVRQTPATYADKAQQKLNAQIAKDREKLDTLRAQKNARIEQIRRKAAEKNKQIRIAEKAAKYEATAKVKQHYLDMMQRQRDAEKAAKYKAVDKAKQHYRDMIQRQRDTQKENAGQAKYRAQVTEKAAKLQKMLLTNSDKMHVPEVLKVPLHDFLASIDFSSKSLLNKDTSTKADEKFHASFLQMIDALERQQNYIENGASSDRFGTEFKDMGGYIDISPDSMTFLKNTASMIYQAMQTGEEYTINEMTAAELKDLSNLLSNLTTAIRNINSFMANERYASIREAADQDIQHMERLGSASNIERGSVISAIGWENGTPYYIFKRFGEGAKSVFDSFTKGWEKMAMNMKEIVDFTEKAYTDKEVQTWQKEMHDITLSDEQTIHMTTAQLMEFSQLLGRAQAVQHEEKGGIRIGDIKQKVGKRVDTKHYHLTTEDITAMLDELTPRQLEVAKALQQFMAKRGADWGNEVSMRRYGYNFYDDGDAYYPIRTDSNDRGMQDTEAMQNSMFRLLNLSASKSLNPRASNALLIGDIFDTFSDHMADMAKLNGMGLPILDAIKWFNYKERIDLGDGEYDTRTLQGAMEQAFGSQAQKYFRTLMKDINGVTEAGDRGTGLLATFMGNYKAAAVAANLRVALLQPTSYVRASALISPRYLLQAFTSRNAYQEALEHSGTATWKAFGYYDTNISRGMREQIEHNDSLKDKIVEKSMVLAELGDKLTWGRLWVACKMQTKAQNKDLTGQALIDKTADLFREVIYATQVMDSTLTRSELMRGKTLYSKAMTAFMAEPTLSYNILMDAVSDYRLDVREKGKAGAWQRNSPKLAKSFAVYAASAAFSAIVESIADAFRDDDPEKFLEKFLNALLGEKGENGLRKLLTGNLLQDLTIIGKLPYVKSMYSTLQGYKSKDMSSAAFDAIIDAVKIWDEAIKLANGTLEKPTKVTYYGNMTTWGKIYKSLQALSQLTGVGVSNLTRDALALWNTSVGTLRPEWRITTYQSKAERTYLDKVRPAGVSWSQYQQAIEGMDTDANGSVKQDEAGPWLAAEVDAGRLTQEQAAAIWSAATSGKKSFEDWLEKNA